MNISYKDLISFVWKFIRLDRLLFFGIFFTSIMWALDSTLWPYILRVVIDILTQFETDRGAVWTALKVPIGWGLFLWLFIELGFRCQGFMLARAIPRLEARIRMAMFDHVQRHSPKYFNDRFAGSLANKITDMTTQVTLVLQQLITLLFPGMFAFILAICFFFNIHPLFAAIVAIWLIAHFTICLILSRKCDHYENLHGEARSSLLGAIVDSFTNNFAVNLFYRFAYEKAATDVFQEEERKAHYRAKKYVELMRLFFGIFTFLIGGVAINGVMLHLWSQGKLTTGEIAQVFNMSWNIIMIMWLVGTAIPGLFQSIGIMKQALTLMQEPQDIADANFAKALTMRRGEIVFDNVSFRYGEKSLFQNKDVHIKGGEKVGLVGYSGSGKSTFVNLILRLYPVETGKIFIDGQDISAVTLESLRSQISLIPQDPLLFHRSLADNIRYGDVEATHEEVVAAARLAHCDEFIRKCSQGYETFVGERGTKLSGGERQRIAIARAILAKAPILILDEATSALDSVTEKYIQGSLEAVMHGRTAIVVAHRLSTLAKMDRILVFDNGKIVEEGSHEELLLLGKHYARMWMMQAGGFLPDTVNAEPK